jgi:hypothetical protein
MSRRRLLQGLLISTRKREQGGQWISDPDFHTIAFLAMFLITADYSFTPRRLIPTLSMSLGRHSVWDKWKRCSRREMQRQYALFLPSPSTHEQEHDQEYDHDAGALLPLDVGLPARERSRGDASDIDGQAERPR